MVLSSAHQPTTISINSKKKKKKKFYSPFKSQSCRTMTDDAARANKRAASILANIPMPKSKRFNLELAPSETKIVIQQPQPSRRSQHLQIVPVANRANTRSQRVLAPPVPSEKDRFALVPKINAGGHEGLAKIAQECAEMCVRPSSAGPTRVVSAVRPPSWKSCCGRKWGSQSQTVLRSPSCWLR